MEAMTAYDRLVQAGLRPSEADAVLAQDPDLAADIEAGQTLREAAEPEAAA